MPAAIPAPLPSWSKWAIALGATPSSYLVSLLTYLGSTTDVTDPAPGVWMHIQAVFIDTFSNRTADEMVVTFDLANITGGGLDSSWTSGDFSTAEAPLVSICTQWMAHASAQVTCKELRWYPRSFNPYTNPKPFPPSGPPVHVTPVNVIGGVSAPIPHQIAVTHTEKTTYPKHWGRCYWPAPAYSASLFGSGGLLTTAFVDAWALAVKTAYDTLIAAEFYPLVPTTTVGGVASRSLLGITAIQVDDIADVQRRRRAWSGVHKTSIPV